MAIGELIVDDVITESTSELSHFNREEIDMQISTARRYPRSIKQFRMETAEMACLDEETAASMFYALPRGGKRIEGPSARFAEVVGAAYGNLRYGARTIGVEGNFIVAEGVCFDVQKNVIATVQVRRRITDSKGNRFNDDMIQVTGNAACSIALRNAIFKVVPMGLVKDIYEQAKLTSIGKAKSITEQRQKMMEWFAKAGATEEMVLKSLGRAGLDDVTTDDLILLRGLVTAIKDGEITIESAFDKVAEKRGVERSNLADVLEKQAAKGNEDLHKKQVEHYREKLKTSAKIGSLSAMKTAVTDDELLLPEDRKALLVEIEDKLQILQSEQAQ
jgi:hypothetical protein